MLDYVDKQLTGLQKQIDNLIKPEIVPPSARALALDGRLTLTSDTPVLTSDVTAATTIYFTPYKGNRVSLSNGINRLTYPLTEISVAVPSTVYRLFDIFLYVSAGTLILEAVNWNQSTAAITAASNASPIVITSNGHGLSNTDMVAVAGVGGNTAANGIWAVAGVTANTFQLEGSTGSGAYTAGGTWYKLNSGRATSLTLSSGRYVKTGEGTKLYLGTGMTTGTSGQTEMTSSNFLLWNYFNRVLKFFAVIDNTSHTYTSASARVYRNVNTNKVGYVTGVVEDAVFYNVQADYNFDSGDGAVSVAGPLNRTAGTTVTTAIRDVFDGRYLVNFSVVYPEAGYNFFQLTQTGAATSPDFQAALIRGGALV